MQAQLKHKLAAETISQYPKTQLSSNKLLRSIKYLSHHLYNLKKIHWELKKVSSFGLKYYAMKSLKSNFPDFL